MVNPTGLNPRAYQHTVIATPDRVSNPVERTLSLSKCRFDKLSVPINLLPILSGFLLDAVRCKHADRSAVVNLSGFCSSDGCNIATTPSLPTTPIIASDSEAIPCQRQNPLGLHQSLYNARYCDPLTGFQTLSGMLRMSNPTACLHLSNGH